MSVNTKTGTGRVARVIGPVVDIEFPADSMPSIYNALEIDVTLSGNTRKLTLEVAQHIGDNLVRAISMQPTDGMVRGVEVRDTGSAISVPVGDVTKGHVFNALGESLDVPTSSLDVKERWPIHRTAPAFDQLESKTEMFETGIKVIDLLTPYVKGGYKEKIKNKKMAAQVALALDGVESELIIDCRSSTYQTVWQSPVAITVEVKVFTKVDGVKKVITHMSKKTRGEVTREILKAIEIPKTPYDLHPIVSQIFECELIAAKKNTPWVLEVYC